MSKNYLDTIKEMFSDTVAMTPEKIQAFIKETMDHLLSLRGKMDSADLKERESAMTSALELKELLEAQMTILKQKMGIDAFQFSESDLIQRMKESEREILLDAKAQFNDLKRSFEESKSKKLNLI